MARELINVTSCDWHAALPDAETPTPAGHERTLENGKQVDLCGFCAWLFDFYYPRRESVLALLQPGVLDSFFRAARDTSPPRRVPAQLALPPAGRPALEPAPLTEPEAITSIRNKPSNGDWKDDVVQVKCPLPHRADKPTGYWVDIRNRTGHAHSHKKPDGSRYEGPDIAFELQPEERFTHYCTLHQTCAEHGGYGFLSEASRASHIHKAGAWQPSSQEAKDAAETRLHAHSA
ncbi:hypothetical protein [Actinacidiphila sp. ITFR-21]|uniref:hypothetical protein n=1 Tax=Actinacidiphila sp. ITFR-21 TaxID=3075199 RepID=UPI00288B33F8|nr:hypothetical protein [Streptomyces sp. ITFR-21]WNI17693.1 hypothetical protein RLT57_20600 [Streptomyces sp. ITFR-21]WNI17833.1 hypothetical protein RLT57_21315 [Streptomyces sp. ITFR-21]